MEFKGECGVDGGNICIIDMKKYGIKKEDVNWCSHYLEMPKGKYLVEVDIPYTHNRPIKKALCLETSGDVYIGDGCYVGNDKEPLVKATDWYSKNAPGALCFNTAGDGSFKVNAKFTKKLGG